ncbi:1-pyrroline-5-carboxylate dehydrogenase [Apiospora rasikravindrae]|uniref:1-pyrroline-5-carboxylate dehydrogenase n=1 Tax=Apiospora rasikravindrae TaxID=990691 RepID=A0ABR1SYW9_9PEZI
MNQGQTEQHVVWAGVGLVLATINAWLAFFLNAPLCGCRQVAAIFLLCAEGLFTFCALCGVASSDSFRQSHKPSCCAAAGLLGLEAGVLVLMFYVPAPAQTDSLVISFFAFGCFWLGLGWEMVLPQQQQRQRMAPARLLDPSDPQINGDWIFQNDRFNRWKTTDGTQLLWIHGLSGAQKTALLSSIIEHMISYCYRPGVDAPRPRGLFNFSFDSSDRQTQSLRAFLESLAVDLVYLNTDEHVTIDSLFNPNGQGHATPSLEELFHRIAVEASYNAVIYLVIDALDECPERERQVFFDQFLQRMLHAKIKMLIISRNIPDIERAIQGINTNDIGMQDPVVDAYVNADAMS